MRLLAIGLSHRTAPVELRECVDFSREGLESALAALAERRLGSETVVLSTCNRAEIYAVAESDTAADTIGRFFSEYHEIDHARMIDHLYAHSGADAARHLFRVAAGLDSLVVGEPQILGQVKAAYAVAQGLQSTGAVTNRLFHSAFAVGKRVRTETGLGEGAVSVSYAAIALAKKIFGDLQGLGVLILGAGEMAKLTGIHLQAQNVRQITIASRTLQTAERLARQLGGRAVPWSELDKALGAADIVVTATGATDPVLTRARIEEVMRPRRNRPLFVIDIALPRDVEAAAGDLDQVFLYNIDDLRTIVKENLTRRSGELARADAIVDEEVGRFVSWMQSREIIPTVVALRRRFEAIRQAELTRLEPKLSSLPPEARARLDEITHLIVEKLLLTPTEQLKSVSDETMIVAYADALNRLFSLAAEERTQPAEQTNPRKVSSR
ncbi:MAG TPA: glutamyl-tRNA reductase [Vicinamibacterales bacterium]|jgi:glutamyl-tRNA reductase|nr:glutamyl-tRNA reductase [Vicinamibacterales bacterium]